MLDLRVTRNRTRQSVTRARNVQAQWLADARLNLFRDLPRARDDGCLGGASKRRIVFEQKERERARRQRCFEVCRANRAHERVNRGFDLNVVLGRRTRAGQVRDQFVNSLAMCGDRRNDRHAEIARQPRTINFYAGACGFVNQIHRDDERHAEVEILQNKIEIPFEVRRVGDCDNRVGMIVEHSLARHPLIFALRAERISTGQINHADRFASESGHPIVQRDGFAGIVRGLDIRASQGIEQ